MYCQRQHLGQISTSKRRVGLELWRTFAEFLKMHKDTHMGGGGFYMKLGAIKLKRNPRLIRIAGRKKTKKHNKIDNTSNLRPELVDDLSGGCYVLEEEACVMCVHDTEEFMWIDHRQLRGEVLGSRCLQ